jgi:hypothetical protein
MDADGLNEIADYSPVTLQMLADTIAKSRGAEQLIYRECELDELWRLLDIEIEALQRDASPSVVQLNRLRDDVMKAHDLIGIDGDSAAAASCVRAAAAASLT